MGYKYLMVATFKAVNRNWKESTDEATEEVQKAEEEKEKETDDAFHLQDPIPEKESKPQEREDKKDEQPVSEEAVVLKAIRVKGLKSSSSTGERRVLTERGEEEDEEVWDDQEQFDPEGPQPLHPDDDCFEEDWNEEDEDMMKAVHQELERLEEKESDEFVDVEEPKDEKIARD